MPSRRSSFLKRTTVEEEETRVGKSSAKHNGRKSAEKEKRQSRVYPTLLPRRKLQTLLFGSKQRALFPHLPVFRVVLPSHSSTVKCLLPLTHSLLSPLHLARERKNRKIFPRPRYHMQSNKMEAEKNFSNHKIALLCPLFKMNTVNDKSEEDLRNFQKAPCVITCVRDTRGT